MVAESQATIGDEKSGHATHQSSTNLRFYRRERSLNNDLQVVPVGSSTTVIDVGHMHLICFNFNRVGTFTYHSAAPLTRLRAKKLAEQTRCMAIYCNCCVPVSASATLCCVTATRNVSCLWHFLTQEIFSSQKLESS